MYYESRYSIDTISVDHRGHCRMSALLGFLQESATEAARAIHLSREEMMEKYHCFWMLARMWVELDRPVFWGDEITVRTWHRPAKGAISYRDFDLYRDGEYIGQAVSAWILAGVDSHKLVRLDRICELTAGQNGGLGKEKTLSRLKLPGQMEEVEVRRLQYSEQDINGHINNTRYADYACDALRMEGLTKREFVRAMQIGFLSECRAGERLTLLTARENGADYVRGVGADGKARFEAALTVQKAE